MRYNVHVTAAFKNHQSTLDIVRALFDDEGKIKPFYKFKKDALAISDKYNKNWLEAEYNTAVGTARMASKWPEYVRRGGSLEFRTQRDERVRDEHRVLDGAIYPVDHSFWDTYYPPLAWRCRCFVRWLKDVVTKAADSFPEIKEMFRNNPGKTGKVFTEAHPYFSTEGKFYEKAQNLFGYKPPVDLDKFRNNLSIFEGLKESLFHKLEFTDNLGGGFVFSHIKHPLNELKKHLAPARMIARRGDSVILQEIIQGQKNPDALISGAIWDFKEVKEGSNLSTAINNRFRSAREQQVSNVVVVLNKSYNPSDLSKAIYTGFYNDRKQTITEVKVILDGKVIELNRKDYEDGRILDKIKNPGT